jgi:hypothetical protein
MSHSMREKTEKTEIEPLERLELTLSEVIDLVDSPSFKDLFKPPHKEWQRYFQSPVDKAAHSTNEVFTFNKLGALTKHREATKFLLGWLDVRRKDQATRGAIRDWVKDGKVLTGDVIDKIAEKLKKETLPNQALYNQPICRLVRRDQLRYDSDYQIIYQLMPGQSRLLEKEQGRLFTHFAQIKRNRRAYWGISEVFQSLIAMFDSELGKVARKKHEEETKEFIRIEVEDGSESPDDKPLTPHRLNMYSPLRFWSPPPVFARCVFHMLFWRSVITNRDLYGREVIVDQDKKEGVVWQRIEERVNYYYVIINWFNVAKYRIANYADLFSALMAVAQSLYDACEKDIGQKLSDMPDVLLKGRDIEKWFYPTVYEHTTVDRRPKLKLLLPFKTVRTKFWELARRYQEEEGRSKDFTRVSDFLKFLRDRALELILWSKYQMEIRSIGIIPVQHLYRLKLTDEGMTNLIKLVELYDPVRGLEENDRRRVAVSKEINRRVSAVKPEKIDEWVKLVKVYGGTHREIVEWEALHGDSILWLEKKRRKHLGFAADTME